MLDIGSGVGDVALLAASLVGEMGQVVGVDRDAIALAKARLRAGAACTTNARFVETDLADLRIDGHFDAIVRTFHTDVPARPDCHLARTGTTPAPGRRYCVPRAELERLFFVKPNICRYERPVGSCCAKPFAEPELRPNMELTLFRGLIESGFEAPQLRVEIPIASDPARVARWVYDLLATIRPRYEELGIVSDAVGDFGTLVERLEAELEAARSYAPLVGLVGAWARKAR